MDLCTICPTFIVGSPFSPNSCTSIDLAKRILLGEIVLLPDITLDCVAVEDVARAHVLAMLTPEAAGKRFLLHGAQMSLQEIGASFGRDYGNKGWSPSTRKLATWKVRLASCFDANAQAMLPRLNLKLKWHPRNAAIVLRMVTMKDDVVAMFRSMVLGAIRVGLVEDKSALLKSKLRRLDKELIEQPPDLNVDAILALVRKDTMVTDEVEISIVAEVP
jgi:hypothetical protein